MQCGWCSPKYTLNHINVISVTVSSKHTTDYQYNVWHEYMDVHMVWENDHFVLWLSWVFLIKHNFKAMTATVLKSAVVALQSLYYTCWNILCLTHLSQVYCMLLKTNHSTIHLGKKMLCYIHFCILQIFDFLDWGYPKAPGTFDKW